MLAHDSNATFVIVPAYNEEKVVRDTVQRLLTLGVNVVVVDDCSEDRTLRMVEDLPIYVLHHAINLGQGAALQTGISFAISRGAQYIVTFDADGQHDERDIPLLIDTLVQEQLDIVLGSRFLGIAENLCKLRKLALKVAIWITKFTSGIHFTDVHNGLRAFRSEVAGALLITQSRMAHASEILNKISKSRMRFKEVPCTVRYTNYSKGKQQSIFGAVDIIYELLLRRLLR